MGYFLSIGYMSGVMRHIIKRSLTYHRATFIGNMVGKYVPAKALSYAQKQLKMLVTDGVNFAPAAIYATIPHFMAIHRNNIAYVFHIK